jgi:nicotinamidase-related amidase
MGELKAPVGPASIHLCVDMQRLFGPEGPWPAPWMERVLPTIVTIVERAPARCIFTRFIPPDQPNDASGTWRAYYAKWNTVTRLSLKLSLLDLMPPLERYVPPATVFDKMVYSAFSDGILHQLLRQKHIDTIIVTGSETDVCVLSTILAAVDLGYRIIVVRDALCSSSDESHDALLELYARRFDIQIELAEAAEVLEAWQI